MHRSTLTLSVTCHQDTKLPDAKFTHAFTSFAFGIFPSSDAALNGGPCHRLPRDTR